MISRDQVVAILFEACPSFRETWDTSKGHDLLYVVMGNLVRHLLMLFRAGRTDEFKPLCEAIERLHVNGDEYVQELATIGFLEGVQNVWGNNAADPEDFCRLLLPVSRARWKELNDFWAGNRHTNTKG